MSVNAIGALERGERRYPYADTVALLVTALGLPPPAAAELQAAAARPSAPRASATSADRTQAAAGDGWEGAVPLQLSSFVGRDTEVTEIRALLAAHRLVTLVGAGGIGKTRTSLRVAQAVREEWSDGVWFIELAPLSSGEYLAATVAAALGIALVPGGEPIRTLLHALRPRRALLLFDNCEHLIEPVARFVGAILRDCSRVVVCATSRQALGIEGETRYVLPALAFPTESEAQRMTSAQAGRYSAVALFVERARGADRDFALSDATAPAVAEICRRLDGMPLAIELASARVRALGVTQLRQRLDERFRILTAGQRDALPRQQTLLALVDWSYDLLDERERTFFRRLGIFVRGFTLDGATAVAGGEHYDEFESFDLLASLVDKSLVLAEPADGDVRYRLHETTRLYGREKLAAAGERAVVADRHLRYLRDRVAAAAQRRDVTGRDVELDAILVAELDDIRAALDWARAGGDVRCGGELMALLDFRWLLLGHHREGLQRLETFAAALSGGDPGVLARLWAAVSRLANFSGPVALPLEAATQAVTLARDSGDATILGRALHIHARNLLFAGRIDEAEAGLAEIENGPPPCMAVRLDILNLRGHLGLRRGDLDAAAAAFEQFRQLHQALGNTHMECQAVMVLADTEHGRGNTDRAIALVREALPAVRAGSSRVSLTILLANFAGYLAAAGDLAEAADIAREVIAGSDPSDADFAVVVANSVEHLALAIALGGDHARAARLAGYADAAPRPLGFARTHTENWTRERLYGALREHIAVAELEALLAQGAALGPHDLVALALAE